MVLWPGGMRGRHAGTRRHIGGLGPSMARKLSMLTAAVRAVDEVGPYREAMPSPDGYFWRCHSTVNPDFDITNNTEMLIDGDRRCFFAPPQSL